MLRLKKAKCVFVSAASMTPFGGRECDRLCRPFTPAARHSGPASARTTEKCGALLYDGYRRSRDRGTGITLGLSESCGILASASECYAITRPSISRDMKSSSIRIATRDPPFEGRSGRAARHGGDGGVLLRRRGGAGRLLWRTGGLLWRTGGLLWRTGGLLWRTGGQSGAERSTLVTGSSQAGSGVWRTENSGTRQRLYDVACLSRLDRLSRRHPPTVTRGDMRPAREAGPRRPDRGDQRPCRRW